MGRTPGRRAPGQRPARRPVRSLTGCGAAGGGTATRRDSGALTLSYVMIVPLFLIAIMLIVQASVLYLAREAALAAARQGADAARVLGASPAAGPRTALAFARSAAHGFLLAPTAAAGGTTAATEVITVRGSVPTLIPMVQFHVSQSAAVPIEQFTTPGGDGA